MMSSSVEDFIIQFLQKISIFCVNVQNLDICTVCEIHKLNPKPALISYSDAIRFQESAGKRNVRNSFGINPGYQNTS